MRSSSCLHDSTRGHRIPFAGNINKTVLKMDSADSSKITLWEPEKIIEQANRLCIGWRGGGGKRGNIILAELQVRTAGGLSSGSLWLHRT